jgi:hypothetical protein
VLPRAVDYFLEVAALFPDAAKFATEHRAEGWECDERTWAELDTRPYFPLDPDDKENRFQRALHFFSEEPAVLRSLEAYLVLRHNAGREGGFGCPRSTECQPSGWHAIGGVRIVVAHTKIPLPGGDVERFTRRPLTDFARADRHVLYSPTPAELATRCGYEAGSEPTR